MTHCCLSHGLRSFFGASARPWTGRSPRPPPARPASRRGAPSSTGRTRREPPSRPGRPVGPPAGRRACGTGGRSASSGGGWRRAPRRRIAAAPAGRSSGTCPGGRRCPRRSTPRGRRRRPAGGCRPAVASRPGGCRCGAAGSARLAAHRSAGSRPCAWEPSPTLLDWLKKDRHPVRFSCNELLGSVC
eukprot:Opistho-1_new@99585